MVLVRIINYSISEVIKIAVKKEIDVSTTKGLRLGYRG